MSYMAFQTGRSITLFPGIIPESGTFRLKKYQLFIQNEACSHMETGLVFLIISNRSLGHHETILGITQNAFPFI